MPLKHDTETALVVLLGAMIVLAGAVAAFLPPVSVTIVPWAIAFAVSILYPLLLYPLFRERRADYTFRLLHFLPALILLLWLAVDLLSAFRPQMQNVQQWYTWGWSTIPVLIALLLLALFCLGVLRARWMRMALLAAVLLPFLIFSQVSERKGWEGELAMQVWNGDLASSSGVLAGGASSNLSPSDDAQEEQWREQLRQMERRRIALEQQGSDGSSDIAVKPTVRGAADGLILSQKGLLARVEDSGPPPQLPHSGAGFESMGVLLAAAYCASLHRRTIRRNSVS